MPIKKVILDSGFVMVCLRKRIDFISQLSNQGFEISIPRESLQSLKDFRFESFTSQEDKILVAKTFDLINGVRVKKKTVGDQNVDDWLIKKGNEGFYIATVNAGILNHIPRKILILDSQGIVKPYER